MKWERYLDIKFWELSYFFSRATDAKLKVLDSTPERRDTLLS